MSTEYFRKLKRIIHCKNDTYKGFKAPGCKKTYGSRWVVIITCNKHGFIKEVSAPDLLQVNVRPSKAQIEETRILNLQILNGFLGDIEIKETHIGEVELVMVDCLREFGALNINELVVKSSLLERQVYESCRNLFKRGLIKRSYCPELTYFI